MRIGLIVDGNSEVAALPRPYDQLRSRTGNEFVSTVKAKFHPNARLPAIGREVVKGVNNLLIQEVDQVVLLLDREERPECPGYLERLLREHVQPAIPVPILVVIKDRKFENWLVADIEALQAMPARFTISNATVQSISPNKADRVDAYRLLQRCSGRDSYQKVRDAQRILEHADMLRMAANSRSFRRFLRCVGHPAYIAQSRDPA